MSYRITELVWKNSKATGVTKLVLLWLAYRANDETAIAWPGLEEISDVTGLHRSTVHRCLQQLLGAGELEAVAFKGGGRMSVHYRVITANARQIRLMPKVNGSHKAKGDPSRSATPLRLMTRRAERRQPSPRGEPWGRSARPEPVSEQVT